MKSSLILLSSMSMEPSHDFSFPAHPIIWEPLVRRFPGFPLIILDRNGKLIFSHEYLRYLKRKGRKKVHALRLNIAGFEALCLNYNLKSALLGINLYEKLFFLKRAIECAKFEEIYRRTSFDLPINSELIGNLDYLLTSDFRDGLASGRLSLKSAFRLLRLAGTDLAAILLLFERVIFSQGEQAKVIEWLEDIAFREKKTFSNILRRLGWQRLLKREMPQKKILAALFRLRFPQAADREKEWRQALRELRMPDAVQVSHSPFFEKNEIEVRLRLKDIKELKNLFASR